MLHKRSYENGPYEKFMKYGPESLSKAELLAIILRTGTKDLSAVDLGEKILTLSGDLCGGLDGIGRLSVDDLMGIPGIGQIKAIKIRCLSEFASRMAMERAEERLSFRSPQSVADYYAELLRYDERETVLLLLLNTKLHLLDEHILSVGTVNSSLLSPREVFIKAIKGKAVSIMLVHNHPSGDPTPSANDIAITEQIYEAGELLTIPLLDHVIVGGATYYSFKEDEKIA